MKLSEQKTPEDIALEQQLRSMQPASLSETTLDGLEKRLASVSAKDVPAITEKSTVDLPHVAKRTSLRPVLWAIAAILIVGLWMVSMFLPGPTVRESTQATQQVPSNGESSFNPSNPAIQTTANDLSEVNESMVRNLRLTNVRDEGIVMSIGHTPMKRLRYEFIDTYQWSTPEGGGQMRMEVPREDFVLVPVSTY